MILSARGRARLLIVVALARQPHTHAAGDGLNALAPQKLVQLRVHANILKEQQAVEAEHFLQGRFE